MCDDGLISPSFNPQPQYLQMGASVPFKQVNNMADESHSNDPPQLAYQVGFALAIVLLAVTMFRYPLW